MKAMILAAGRGERLRPLTDDIPKPLIEVGGRPLIHYHLHALARAGFDDIVINLAYRATPIMAALGDGTAWGLRIRYSLETPGALDTGGGVRNALALLDDAPFALISADVFTDFDYAALPALGCTGGLHAVLVDNPPHHPRGDFGLHDGRLVAAEPRLTYAGIGVYTPALFRRVAMQRFPLSAVLKPAVAEATARGTHHRGRWFDVGRPSALAAAREASAAG